MSGEKVMSLIGNTFKHFSLQPFISRRLSFYGGGGLTYFGVINDYVMTVVMTCRCMN